MTASLVALPVAIPLLGAATATLARSRILGLRILAGAVAAAHLGLAIWLLAATADGDVLVAHIGGWPPPFAISFAVDAFSAVMLLVSSTVIYSCVAFAAIRGDDRAPLFYPMTLTLVAGVSGSFLTADLFNLFVFFEVMLISSYVMMMGGSNKVGPPVVYVTVNLLGSTLLLLGIGMLYAATGSVNMARLGTMAGASDSGAIAGALLMVAFSVKAALVPVHGWLPTAYPAAGVAVAAMFSGVLTKVGVYALYRVRSVVFGGSEDVWPLLLAVACATMVVGVLGALGRDTIRGILSFHIVSQVGYMVLGLALWTPLAVAGGIFYLIHHIVVKTSLFLSAGAVETATGRGSLKELGGLRHGHPLLAAAFLIGALALAGVPPSSGFFAKLVLIQGALGSDRVLAGGIAIAVGFLTLVSMLKIYNAVFAGPPPETVTRGRWVVTAPALLLVVASLAIGLAAPVILDLSQTAAAGLMDATNYTEALLP